MKKLTRVISFTSGKGGVGKSSSVLNCAIALAQQGRNVLVLDADMSLANVDVMLGLKTRHTLEDFFSGEASLEELLIDGPEGIHIIPAASGIEHMCQLGSDRLLVLCEELERLALPYDYLLIDTAAGIGSNVMHLNSASSEIVCVINPEPTSITDAYALIKVLSSTYGEKSISILANNVVNEREALMSYKRLARAVERFLHVQLKYLGFVPQDSALKQSIQEQKALVQIYPSSPAAVAFSGLARRLEADAYQPRVKGGMQIFFRQLMELSANGF